MGLKPLGLMAENTINHLKLNRIKDETHEKLGNLIKMLISSGLKQDRIAKEYFLMNVKYSDKI